MQQQHSQRSLPLAAIVITATAATAVLVTLTAYLANPSVFHKYGGLRGILRLVWEGDHIPSHIRDATEFLDDMEGRIPTEETILELFETLVETVRLDSVDDDGCQENSITDALNESRPTIPKDLYALSHRLDSFAFVIDSLQTHGDAYLKQRKKSLSTHLVTMMERTDRLIGMRSTR